jgi:nucleoid DNA-binding protein
MAKKKAAAPKKAPTKSEIYRTLAENTGVARKDVVAIFDELNGMIAKNLKKSGPQMFTIPGLAKIVVNRKPATKAKKGVPNPFKPGELMDVAAKPARNVVKVRPLKGLKDMA